jgi:formiminotetrahydrofolate cyclodeaminase
MVGNLTMGRLTTEAAEQAMRKALEELERLRESFLRLAAADEAVYSAYARAAALPRVSNQERAARRAATQAALIDAAGVPMTLAESLGALFTALTPIARLGNRHLLSDAAIAAFFGEAALRGAARNVRVNAELIADRAVADQLLARSGELETSGQESVAALLAIIDERSGRRPAMTPPPITAKPSSSPSVGQRHALDLDE